ncbi:MAG: hypothetical protein ABIO43_03215 [Sphingomicrobium sp.]
MLRIGDVIRHRSRDDFSEGDHQEYVEPGFSDAALIGGISLLLIGALVGSLLV